ncbi:MAG: prolyl oligopeptidase family serine peptidase [Candidatus Glassbacteria bacterium]|nr:prolyl oligopeptidase family serine peptidase [Candidatus Glassbacteria bacterium]
MRSFPTRTMVAALLCALCLLTPLAAQEINVETASLDIEMVQRFLEHEAAKTTAYSKSLVSSREAIEANRERLYREYMYMIGLDPLPPRTPLHVTTVRTVERDEYTVEVLHFQSMPGYYVTANVYVPKKGGGPFPAVVWGPGHSSGPYGAKALRQNYAIPWVRNGYVCMIVDPVQVAEVFGIHRGTSVRGIHGWHSRGYTPIGIEVWNAMRAVDYLLTRSDVDGEKLTINGVSGGGHLSWMAGAADNRFTVVQPVAGTADVQAHVELNLQNMHCDCAYFLNTYRHDWPTLAALIAPRALLMHNSTGDAYYPPEGYERVLGRAKEIFGFFGVPEKTDMFEVEGRHGYTQPQREKAVEWSDRWLKGKITEVRERPFEPVEPRQLGSLGGLYAEHPPNINARVHEVLIPAAEAKPFANLLDWKWHRAQVMEKLREVVFRNMPTNFAAARNEPGRRGQFLLETEPGVKVGIWIDLPESAERKSPAILYVASPGDRNGPNWHFNNSYPFDPQRYTMNYVYPRGTGREPWDEHAKRKVQRTAVIVGRTLDDMRLADVLAAVDFLVRHPAHDGSPVTVIGKGRMGVIAAYAALLDERIGRVILHRPPLSHNEAPVFLNVLRYTDIPQALAMLAPRELVFLTGEVEHFAFTRSIYELYGAGKNFRRCWTVAQALNRKP